MISKRNLIIILGFMICQTGNSLFAQDFKHQVSLQHDNDLYLLIDQYYTAATHLRYDRLVDTDTTQTNQWYFKISQELYTPYLSTPQDTTLYDRPFAGLLRFQSSYRVLKRREAWLFTVYYTLVGSQTKAGDVHKFYHRLIDEQAPAWQYEMPNKHHLNISAERWDEFDTGFPLIKKLRWEHKVSLGTLETYAQTGLNLDFTRLVGLNKSLASGSLASDEGFNFNTGLYYRYQLYDSTIEGHLLNQQAVFKKSIVHHLLIWKFSAIYQLNAFRLKLAYHQISKKNINMRKHAFVSLKIGFLF